MRDYQLKKVQGGALPHSVYMQVKHMLLDYDRLLAEREMLLYGSCFRQGVASKNGVSKPTERRAIRLSYVNGAIDSIEKSLLEVCGELEGKVEPPFDPKKAYFSYDYFNLCFTRRDEDDLGPAKRTWQYYKSRLSRKIAEKSGMV